MNPSSYYALRLVRIGKRITGKTILAALDARPAERAIGFDRLLKLAKYETETEQIEALLRMVLPTVRHPQQPAEEHAEERTGT